MRAYPCWLVTLAGQMQLIGVSLEVETSATKITKPNLRWADLARAVLRRQDFVVFVGENLFSSYFDAIAL